MIRIGLISSVLLVIGYSQSLLAADVQFDPFFKSSLRIYETQTAATIKVNNVNFVRKSWKGGDDASVLFDLNVKGVTRKTVCRYRLDQSSVAHQGRKRSFEATLAMPLNKKGVAKKLDHETYCKANVVIKNVNLYLIHKNLMGIEVNFSSSDSYRAKMQNGGNVPRYFLSTDPNAELAKLFGFKILPFSAFSKIDHRRFSNWMSNQEVLHSEIPSPLIGVRLAAAGGITAGQGEYSGLGILRMRPLPGKKLGNACDVLLSSASVKDKGNMLSFKASLSRQDPKCEKVVSQITAFDFYAITPTLLGIQVTFDDKTWIRAPLSLREGGQKLIVDSAQTASYASLFTAAETLSLDGSSQNSKTSTKNGSKNTKSAKTKEFSQPEESFWQKEIWKLKPFGSENRQVWTDAGPRRGTSKVLNLDSRKMTIEYGPRIFSVSINPNDNNIIGLKASGSCDKGIHVEMYTHSSTAWKDYIEQPKIKNIYGVEESLIILRKAFESFCGSIIGFRLEMEHRYGPGIFKKKKITARATYGESSQWKLVDGFITEKPMDAFRYKLSARENYLRATNDSDYCKSEPQIFIKVNRNYSSAAKAYNSVPVSSYESMVSKVVDNYLTYCKQTKELTVSFSEQPDYRWCEDDKCRITVTKAEDWHTDFSKTFRERYRVKNYGDVIAAYQGDYVKGLNVNRAYLAGFHRNFIEIYASQCRSMIKDLVTMTFQAVEQDIIGGVVWREEKVGPPRHVTIDSRAKRAWSRAENSFNFRTVFSAVLSGNVSNVLTGLDQSEKNAKWLRGFVRENGCSSENVSGFYNTYVL